LGYGGQANPRRQVVAEDLAGWIAGDLLNDFDVSRFFEPRHVGLQIITKCGRVEFDAGLDIERSTQRFETLYI
jgi:hypothetical protein